MVNIQSISMDLSAAFGTAFVFADAGLGAAKYPHVPSGKSNVPKPTPTVTTSVDEPVKSLDLHPATTMPYESDNAVPDVYIFNIQIGRDDCHLMCMFLLVFTISFILGSRKGN